MNNIKIISYNICALPFYFNLYGNPHKRITKIINFIKNQNPEIVCLQEVFDEEIRKIIIKQLSKIYHIYLKSRTSKYKYNNGLVICSIYPITSKRCIQFKNVCGEDRLAEKGILYCKIRINISGFPKEVTLVNTHLNANALFSFRILCVKTRKKQLSQLNKILSNIKTDIILCGDFNLDFYKNKVNNFINPIKLKKFMIKSDNIITYPSAKSQYDYIFYMTNVKRNISYKYKTYKNKFSDHFPLQLLLTSNKG